MASHGQYYAGQLNSMDHNFFENDSPEEELKEDMLVKLINNILLYKFVKFAAT